MNKSAILAYRYFSEKKPEFIKTNNTAYLKVDETYYLPRFLKMGGVSVIYKSDFDQVPSKDVRYLLFRMGESTPFMQVPLQTVLKELKEKKIVEINNIRFKYPQKPTSIKIGIKGPDVEMIRKIKEKGKFNSYSEVVTTALKMLERAYNEAN